jgi:hypothetical protein
MHSQENNFKNAIAYFIINRLYLKISMANFVHKSPRVNVNADSSKVSSLFKRINDLSSTNSKTLSARPMHETKKGFSLRAILGSVVLFLLVAGSASALFLTQINQDVRQQASGCTYWNGQPATEGAIDNRGGIRQECKNGYWSAPSDGNTNPTSGTTGTSGSGGGSISSSSQTGNASTCAADEIFCGGCIAGCKKATQTCNNWIDQECKVQGCGGNGVFPAPGEQCCSGLQQCANGRCGASCGLDNNPICGGIREGSDCNNGGSWKCDSTQGGGSGHCDGGAWSGSNGGQTRISCEIAGNIIYFSSQEACDTARKAGSVAETIIGGIADALNEIRTTVSSTKTDTHTQRCDLNGTIVYVADASVCTTFSGTIVNGWVGPCCVGGEYKSLCRPEDRESTPANSNDCKQVADWVGPCCVGGEYKSLCRPEDRESTPANSNDCRADAGGGCTINHATQCNEGVLYECMNEEWVSQGSCGQTGIGPFVQTTCYYAGSGGSCNTAVKYLRPDESCGDIPSGTFYDSSACGGTTTSAVSVAPLDGDFNSFAACRSASMATPAYDHCWKDGDVYVLREITITIDSAPAEEIIEETETLPAGTFATSPECIAASRASEAIDICERSGDRYVLRALNVTIISDQEEQEEVVEESVIPGGNSGAASDTNSGGVGQAIINGWNSVTSWVRGFSLSNLWGNNSGNTDNSVIPGGQGVIENSTCYSWNGSGCDSEVFEGIIDCRSRGLYNTCNHAEQEATPVEVVEPAQPVIPAEPVTVTCYFATIGGNGTCYSSEYPAGTDCGSLSQGNVVYGGSSCMTISAHVNSLTPVPVDQ